MQHQSGSHTTEVYEGIAAEADALLYFSITPASVLLSWEEFCAKCGKPQETTPTPKKSDTVHVITPTAEPVELPPPLPGPTVHPKKPQLRLRPMLPFDAEAERKTSECLYDDSRAG